MYFKLIRKQYFSKILCMTKFVKIYNFCNERNLHMLLEYARVYGHLQYTYTIKRIVTKISKNVVENET